MISTKCSEAIRNIKAELVLLLMIVVVLMSVVDFSVSLTDIIFVMIFLLYGPVFWDGNSCELLF